jgi:hypothetical protein
MPSLVSHLLGERLTAAARHALPASDFAEPEKEGYPIEDRKHAANALSRVSGNGSSAEKARVKRKVCAKYPDMPSCREAVDDKFKPLTDKVLEALDVVDSALFETNEFQDQWLRDQLDTMIQRWGKKLLELNQAREDEESGAGLNAAGHFVDRGGSKGFRIGY